MHIYETARRWRPIALAQLRVSVLVGAVGVSAMTSQPVRAERASGTMQVPDWAQEPRLTRAIVSVILLALTAWAAYDAFTGNVAALWYVAAALVLTLVVFLAVERLNAR